MGGSTDPSPPFEKAPLHQLEGTALPIGSLPSLRSGWDSLRLWQRAQRPKHVAHIPIPTYVVDQYVRPIDSSSRVWLNEGTADEVVGAALTASYIQRIL
jgi:hypothetical protein